jgi:hypothetical protein
MTTVSLNPAKGLLDISDAMDGERSTSSRYSDRAAAAALIPTKPPNEDG